MLGDPAPPPASGARAVRRGLATLALLLLAWLGWREMAVPPRAREATAPDSLFSAARAMRHVAALAVEPRPAGTPAGERARRYVWRELARLGLQPDTQVATGVSTRYRAAGRVINVVGRLPGTRSGGKAVVLMAHYDGVGAGPGASDDAHGVAVILEALRGVREGTPLGNDVIAVITDAEEDGLLGAAAFAAEHPWRREVGIVLNFEARGTGGRAVLIETGRGNLGVVRAYARRASHPTASSVIQALYEILPNDTDFSELLARGAQGLNFAYAHGVARYHTPLDDTAHLDRRSLQQQGDAALALLRHFGHGVLPPAPSGDGAFFPLPLAGLVSYPLGWTKALTALAVGTLVAGIAAGLARGRMRMRDPLLGLAGVLVSLVLAAALAWLWHRGVTAFHRAPGRAGPVAFAGTYGLAIVVMGALVVVLVERLARRWAAAPGLDAGALAFWAAAAVLTAKAFPGANYLFLWPLLLGTGAVAFSRTRRWAGWLTAAAGLLLVAPILYAVFMGLGLQPTSLYALTVLAVLLAWLVAPVMREIEGARWWALPAPVALTAVALSAFGAATLRYDASRPRPNELFYVEDADSGTAHWLGFAPTDAWTRAVLDAAAPPTEVPPLLRASHVINFLAAARPALRAPAPRAGLMPPEAALLADSVAGRRRELRWRLTSPRRARVMLVHARADSLEAWVDGRPVPMRPQARGMLRLALVHPPAEGFELRLAVYGEQLPDLELADVSGGLPSLPGVEIPPRPPGMVPHSAGDQTLVRRRYAIGKPR